MSMKKRLKNFFVTDQSGVVLMELIVMLPGILFAFYMGFVFFDAYRAKAASERAAYTVADLISRETGSVNSAYIDGMGEVFSYLTDSGTDSYAVRVTSLTWIASDQAHEIDWSDATGSYGTMTANELNALTDNLPVMADGDTIMILETSELYEPPLSGLVGKQTFDNMNIVRARFVPKVEYNSGGSSGGTSGSGIGWGGWPWND